MELFPVQALTTGDFTKAAEPAVYSMNAETLTAHANGFDLRV